MIFNLAEHGLVELSKIWLWTGFQVMINLAEDEFWSSWTLFFFIMQLPSWDLQGGNKLAKDNL